MASMRLINRVAAALLAAVSLVGLGCGPSQGGPVALSDFPAPALTIRYDAGGLVATLDYPDIPRCDLLNDDAFATLNGQSVPLFPGSVKIVQEGDGEVICAHPSVILEPFPSDLAPPWTLEIGDPTAVLSATFAPAPIDPFTVGADITPVLTSSLDNLTVQIQRPTGGTTPALARSTLTASDGQSCTSVGAVGESSIVFGNPIFPGWPAGPITVQIEVEFEAVANLLSCQAPKCSVVLEGDCGPWATIPDDPGPGVPCAGVVISSTTTTFSIQLSCPGGLCN
jgi:hypothetical protein